MVRRCQNIKVCLAASAGGHMTQLLKLADSWDGCDHFFVTTTDVIKEKLGSQAQVYIVGECNYRHLIRTITVLLKCIPVVLRERPDVVISTGAASGCVMCFLGKLLGAKVLWIDSITNVRQMSLSGRMVRYIADMCLVQWPEMVKRYKNVEYAGHLI
jgi:UDP-N-acetylglucosamine:LPS N-acetylglucosamine transferase